VAIGTDGDLYSWGNGQFGQLGHGSYEDEKQPKKIEFLKDHQVDEVSCGLNHTCFRTK
jgi:alpha-tubulin suppressor-like RCC1 family protein